MRDARAERADCQSIRAHYENQWHSTAVAQRWDRGPAADLPRDFEVLVFAPAVRTFWTYATCGMSQAEDAERLELHLFSPVADDGHVELLTAIAHYDRTGERLGLGHIVNFGRPWLPGSECDRGLISLPYLDGPDLEHGSGVRFLWLIPITNAEAAFATAHGLEALEQRWEEVGFNYLDPRRRSAVA